MAGRATRCSMGLQDDCATRATPFKLAYGSEAVVPAEVHLADHKVMKYQDKENEE